jgi:hypothetical protein
MITTSSRRSRLRFMVLGSCLLLGALTGCGSDNPVNPQPPGPKYLASSTPQNTLENLRRAYTTRDSTGYDSLFDAGYVGTSYDPSNLNPLTFTRADEKRHVAALAHATSVTSVLLYFPPTVIRETDGADPPGWATISMQNMQLSIEDTPSSLNLVPGGTWEFKFAPTTPSVGSPTDTTWHVVRWTELP